MHIESTHTWGGWGGVMCSGTLSGSWDCAGSGCAWASCLHWTRSDAVWTRDPQADETRHVAPRLCGPAEESGIPPSQFEDSLRLTLLFTGLRWKQPLAIWKKKKKHLKLLWEFLNFLYVDNCSFYVCVLIFVVFTHEDQMSSQRFKDWNPQPRGTRLVLDVFGIFEAWYWF